MDLLVPGRFEQRFRIRAIVLLRRTDTARVSCGGSNCDGVAELFQGARRNGAGRPAGSDADTVSGRSAGR